MSEVKQLFSDYQANERTAILALVANCLPIEYVSADLSEEDQESTWSHVYLSKLAAALRLDKQVVAAYLPLVLQSWTSSELLMNADERTELLVPFISILTAAAEQRETFSLQKLYVQLLIFNVHSLLLDGRGRTLLRNLQSHLSVSGDEAVAAEYLLAQGLLQTQQEAIKRKEDANSTTSRAIRYTKIGAVAVGAGAVLAVTGGLAAPAIAGAVLLLGSATAAAAISVTTMAIIFGGTGAGLAGYKMLRRTRGTQEFEFEQYDEKDGKMVVMIMVSGWLESEEDYKRTFGVLPSNLTHRERLVRYYQHFAPNRLQYVDIELESFDGRYDELYAKLWSVYGSNPLEESTYIPQYPPVPTASPYVDLINTCLLEMTRKSQQSITGKISSMVRGGRRSDKKDQVIKGAAKKEETTAANSHSSPADGSAALESIAITKESADDDDNSKQYTSEEIESIDTEELQERIEEEITENVKEIHFTDAFRYWHWRELNNCSLYELYLLRWDINLQIELGKSILTMLRNLGLSSVEKVLSMTVLSGLAAAAAWPVALLSLTNFIDSLWAMAVERADLAGKELAKALLARPQGSRPVTLVGYSIGARVIFSCLRELSTHLELCSTGSRKLSAEPLEYSASESSDISASGDAPEDSSSSMPWHKRTKEADAALNPVVLKGLIQDVVLLGAPVNTLSSNWAAARAVVGGRFINAYSQKDLVLGIIYRFKRFQFNVSGCTPVNVRGVEDVDLSSMIEKHVDYCRKMKDILHFIDLRSQCSNGALMTANSTSYGTS